MWNILHDFISCIQIKRRLEGRILELRYQRAIIEQLVKGFVISGLRLLKPHSLLAFMIVFKSGHLSLFRGMILFRFQLSLLLFLESQFITDLLPQLVNLLLQVLILLLSSFAVLFPGQDQLLDFGFPSEDLFRVFCKLVFVILDILKDFRDLTIFFSEVSGEVI